MCNGMVGKDGEGEVADWKTNGCDVRFVDEVVEEGIGEGAGVEISPFVASVSEAVFLDATGCLLISKVDYSSQSKTSTLCVKASCLSCGKANVHV